MSRKKATPTPRRQARERLKPCVLEELWSIWRADPRVPSIESRRLWATSRDASPHLVDGWFLRRRRCAKKAGESLPEGSYDISLDRPVVPKREPSVVPVEPEREVLPDPSSDDTLAYPPDDASSDTAFDEDASIEPKSAKPPAYNPQLYYPKNRADDSCAFQDEVENCYDENPCRPICNLRGDMASDFTCILCSKASDQGTPDEVLPTFGTASDSTENSSVLFPATPWELSAIPFLFCTPPVVTRDNVVDHRIVDDWAILEDEFGRLVNDGKLDLTFLDHPHISSMVLDDCA